MKHTAHSEPGQADQSPITAPLGPKQPDIAPVGSFIPFLIWDFWSGPD